MKKRKYMPGLILLFVLALSMAACGSKTADEAQIIEELTSNQEFSFLTDREQIDEIIIEKRQTDKDQKTDTVWCTVITSDAEISYQKSVVLTYGLYDKEGWILDDVKVEAKGQWIMTPLKGISEEDALDSLYGHSIIVENEEWVITRNNLLRAEIEDRQTDLEEEKDKLTISLVLDEEIERAEGKIEVSYFFDQGWKFDAVLSNSDFTAEMKAEYALNVTEEDLIKEMSGLEITYAGNGSQGKQTVTVDTQEISDFVIEEHTSEDKGSIQIYSCSYNLNKPHVVLKIEVIIAYRHQSEDGWTARVDQLTSQVISANIAGDWSGTYNDVPWEGRAELHISEIQEDGTVTAIYRFIPDSRTKDPAGSYELSGYWDSESLRLILEAGEWIEQPAKITILNDKNNITAQFNIEKDRFEGYGQGNNYFRVLNRDGEAD